MSTCRSCGQEIEWVFTEHDKRMPLDAGVRDDGNLIVIARRASEYGMTPVVRYVKAGEGNRVSHFATCPGAEEYRRG